MQTFEISEHAPFSAEERNSFSKDKTKWMSAFELSQLVSAMFGLMYCYSLLVSYITPFFMETYSISIKNIGFINIATPITSLIAQLCVGTWSDKLQKRSGFFRCGIAALVAGLFVLPFASKLFPGSSAHTSLVVALIATWLAGFGLNSALVVLRAAVADLVPKMQQKQANAIFATAAGLGLLSNYFLASINLLWLRNAFGLTNTEVLFVVGSMVCFLCSLATDQLLRKDDLQIKNALRRQDSLTAEGFAGGLSQVFAFWRLPRWLSPACAALFWTWVGWFALLMFVPEWTSSDIFGGGEAANDGLRWASLCLALQAGVCSLLGLGWLEKFMQEKGPNKSLVATLWIQAALQLSLLLPQFLVPYYPHVAKGLLLVQIGLMGAPWGLIHCIPYVIIGEHGDPQRNGKLMGRLNTFIVLAQLLVAFAVRPLALLFTESQALKVILLGGCCNILGLLQFSMNENSWKQEMTKAAPATADSESPLIKK